VICFIQGKDDFIIQDVEIVAVHEIKRFNMEVLTMDKKRLTLHYEKYTSIFL